MGWFDDVVDKIPPTLIPGIGFLVGKGPWAGLLNGRGGGGDNGGDLPDPFAGIGDAFNNPAVKIGLVAGLGLAVYYVMRD